MERVGFGSRLGAALIDTVILIVGMSILGSIFGVGMAGFAAGGAPVGFSLGIIILALIPIAYMSTEIFLAATPGKQFLKLIIRNEDGTPASQETLIKRWAFKSSGSIFNVLFALTTLSIFNILGTVAGLIVFIGCFFVLSDPKQAFHDKFAKTAVYKTAAE